MNEPVNLNKFFNLGICGLDKEHKITFQNSMRDKICGKKVGDSCEGTCIDGFETSPDPLRSQSGTQYFTNKLLNNHLCDVFVVKEEEEFVIMFYLKESKIKKDLNYFKERGLTGRELEIVQLILSGLKNKEITKQLFISISTLKTHINNIYKKLPVHFIARKRK